MLETHRGGYVYLIPETGEEVVEVCDLAEEEWATLRDGRLRIDAEHPEAQSVI